MSGTWTELFRLTVIGIAQPRGSKTSMPMYDRKTGYPLTERKVAKSGRVYYRVISRTIDDNPKSGPWMKQVTSWASRIWKHAEPYDGPVFLDCTIYRERPQIHLLTSGEPSPKAPALPVTKPDLTKLVRAIEDALAKLCYTDDARITDHRTRKRFGTPPRIELTLYGGPKTVAEMRVTTATLFEDQE